MEKEVNREHNYVEELLRLIRSNLPDEELRDELSRYHENDIADAIEELTKEERLKLYPILGAEWVSEIFTYVEDPDEYLQEMKLENVAMVLSHMDSDDAVDVLEEFDEPIQEQIVNLMDDESKEDVQLILSYDEDEIGSYMTTNFILIQKGLSIRQAMKELVSQAGENDNITTIYVENEDHTFYGAIDLKDLILARREDDLDDITVTSYPYIFDHEDVGECLDRIRDYEEDSIPVVNKDMIILGVITAHDVIEAVDDEMGEDYAKFAGLTAEEDLNESLKESMKKRLPWLIALLFLGMGVSTVVGVFETVVAVLPIVICFQSLILDMAGNVGTQSLAVTIRVLTDEELSGLQKMGLVLKEVRVGLCNGMFLGALTFVFIGIYTSVIKHNTIGHSFMIAACVGLALMLAMIVSSLVGTVIPMFFHKINVDPAVASGPLITTVNDLVAVVTYYSLAWLLLIRV